MGDTRAQVVDELSRLVAEQKSEIEAMLARCVAIEARVKHLETRADLEDQRVSLKPSPAWRRRTRY